MGKRLKQLLEALKIKQNQFAQSVDVSPSHVSDILTGRRNGFSIEVVVKIAELYNVNLNWLLTGEGEMFTSAPGDTPGKVMQSDAKKNGHLAGYDGKVEEYPDITESEQISRTGWWKKLDSAGKYIEATVPELSPDARKRIKAMIEYELRAQEEIEKELAEEAKYKYQKGEAG